MAKDKMGQARIDRADSIARAIRDLSIPELNEVTKSLAEWGIAAFFSQYIPELHDAETDQSDEHDHTSSPAKKPVADKDPHPSGNYNS